MSLDDVAYLWLEDVLEEAGGNLTELGRRLGMKRQQVMSLQRREGHVNLRHLTAYAQHQGVSLEKVLDDLRDIAKDVERTSGQSSGEVQRARVRRRPKATGPEPPPQAPASTEPRRAQPSKKGR